MTAQNALMIGTSLIFLALLPGRAGSADMVDNPGFDCTSGTVGNDYCEGKNAQKYDSQSSDGSRLKLDSENAGDEPSADPRSKKNFLKEKPDGITSRGIPDGDAQGNQESGAGGAGANGNSANPATESGSGTQAK